MWENNLRSWKRVTTLFSSSFYYMLLVALKEKFCWSFVITVARIVLLLYARSCRSISGIESRPNVVVSNSDTGVDVLTASRFYPLPEPCSCNPDAGSILRFIFSLALHCHQILTRWPWLKVNVILMAEKRWEVTKALKGTPWRHESWWVPDLQHLQNSLKVDNRKASSLLFITIAVVLSEPKLADLK